MKIFCCLFLILVVTSSMAFAQTKGSPEPEQLQNALVLEDLLEEFGAVPNGQMRMYLDVFFTGLQNNPTAKGYIFNYGAKREVAKREKLFRNHISFRKTDASQITFAKGKNELELRTQLWIVPEGAESPKP